MTRRSPARANRAVPTASYHTQNALKSALPPHGVRYTGFRNGPLGVKPASDDLATVIVLPSVVDMRVATSCHQMGTGEPILSTGSCLVGGHCRIYGFTGSPSR